MSVAVGPGVRRRGPVLTTRPAGRPLVAAAARAPAGRAAIGVGLASLSLLVARQPTYDPYAWLIWGREISGGTLDTVAGPSWKPLPVIFTTAYAAIGDTLAPALWLVTARVAWLVAVFFAFRLAASIAGPLAGALAAGGVVLINDLASLSLRGTSEGILVAAALVAIDRHRHGRTGQALALGVVAALIRPELWPFVGLAGLWWAATASPPGARMRRLAVVAVGSLAVLALWFAPEKAGSGKWLRGATRALEPVAGTPAQSAHPFVSTLANAVRSLDDIIYVGAAVALVAAVRAWRRGRAGDGDRLVVWLLAAALAYMVIVAALAQAGFTGSQRYAVLPAALVSIAGAIGLVRIWDALGARHRGRWLRAIAVVVVVATAIEPAAGLVRDLRHAVVESERFSNLGPVVDHVGGRQALLRCPPLVTGNYETQIMAWTLHLHPREIGIHPGASGTTLATAGTPQGTDTALPLRHSERGWVLRRSCD